MITLDWLHIVISRLVVVASQSSHTAAYLAVNVTDVVLNNLADCQTCGQPCKSV